MPTFRTIAVAPEAVAERAPACSDALLRAMPPVTLRPTRTRSVRVAERPGFRADSFHAAAPHKEERKTYTAPGSFGKIDIADFDPSNWKNQGPR